MSNFIGDNEAFVDVAGVRCVRHDTSALEGWLIMHSLRRVLCGGEDFPSSSGKLAVIASQPLMQKEIDFINEMSRDGSCPPVGAFLEQTGSIVGVVDFEIERETDLPGWDGTPNPVLLFNPHWFMEGKLVPVPPDMFLPDERRDERRHGARVSARGRRGR